MKTNSQKQRMVISGLVGFSFFLIANFTTFFQELNIIAGILQLSVNIFVFIVWLEAFRKTSGLTKFIAFWGVLFPFIMAGITLTRVIVPTIIKMI